MGLDLLQPLDERRQTTRGRVSVVVVEAVRHSSSSSRRGRCESSTVRRASRRRGRRGCGRRAVPQVEHEDQRQGALTINIVLCVRNVAVFVRQISSQ